MKTYLITGAAVLMIALAALFAAPWLFPVQVIKYSPWLEPALRVYANLGESHPNSLQALEAFDARSFSDESIWANIDHPNEPVRKFVAKYTRRSIFYNGDVERIKKVLGPRVAMIKQLDLGMTKITIDDIKALSDFTGLDELSLEGLKLGPGWMKDVVFPASLKKLSVRSAGVTDSDLASITKLPNLEIVVLSENPIGDGAIDEMLRMPRLKKVYLINTRVSDFGLSKLRADPRGIEIISISPF
jgi:hypothetical protein